MIVENDIFMSATDDAIFASNSAIQIGGPAQGNAMLNNRIRERLPPRSCDFVKAEQLRGTIHSSRIIRPVSNHPLPTFFWTQAPRKRSLSDARRA